MLNLDVNPKDSASTSRVRKGFPKEASYYTPASRASSLPYALKLDRPTQGCAAAQTTDWVVLQGEMPLGRHSSPKEQFLRARQWKSSNPQTKAEPIYCLAVTKVVARLLIRPAARADIPETQRPSWRWRWTRTLNNGAGIDSD